MAPITGLQVNARLDADGRQIAGALQGAAVPVGQCPDNRERPAMRTAAAAGPQHHLDRAKRHVIRAHAITPHVAPVSHTILGDRLGRPRPSGPGQEAVRVPDMLASGDTQVPCARP